MTIRHRYQAALANLRAAADLRECANAFRGTREIDKVKAMILMRCTAKTRDAIARKVGWNRDQARTSLYALHVYNLVTAVDIEEKIGYELTALGRKALMVLMAKPSRPTRRTRDDSLQPITV